MSMRTILVGMRRVVDFNVRIRVNADGSGVVTDGVKLGINPFDEIAIEEALRLRDAGHADEVAVVSVGPDDVQQQLRTALAMGADRAILVRHDAAPEPLAVARVLLAIAMRGDVRLVLLGKQNIDEDNGQTGQMLAALWDRPQATFASRIVVDGDSARVTREVDAGLEIIEVDLPAVITTDLRLNEPRFVKLPVIMKAKRKPLEILELAALDIDATPRFMVRSYEAPPSRARGVMVRDVEELVSVLRQRGAL